MKYWHVRFDKEKNMYQLRDSEYSLFTAFGDVLSIAVFHSFDMAYDYVTKLNGNQSYGITASYSRWAVR